MFERIRRISQRFRSVPGWGHFYGYAGEQDDVAYLSNEERERLAQQHSLDTRQEVQILEENSRPSF